MTKRFSKKGFTLVEMMLVVAVILILSAVTTYGLSAYIRKSNEQAEEVAAKGQVYDQAMLAINSIVNQSPASMPAIPTDGAPVDGGAGGGGGLPAGGGDTTPVPTVVPTAAPTNIPTIAPTVEATATPAPTATATPIPTATPVPTTAPAGGAGGAGGATPGSTGKVKLSTDNQWYKSANTSITSSDGITKVVITAPDGVTIKQVNDANNGGQYKVSVSNGKTVTIEFDSSLTWATKQKTININGIVWEGQAMNIELDFEVYN